jgi:hypothetical protein
MMFFSSAWYLICEIIGACRKVTSSKAPLASNRDSDGLVANNDRRMFLKVSANAGLSMVAGAMTVTGVFQGVWSPEMKEICVPIKHLPEELQDFSIVQISDLHINTTTRVEWLQDIVAKVNSLSPDIVAFTGDFADGSLADLNPILKPITTLSSRFGNYFVTGNHEYSYSHGIISEGGVAKWKRKIEEFGFRVLLNENRILSIFK